MSRFEGELVEPVEATNQPKSQDSTHLVSPNSINSGELANTEAVIPASTTYTTVHEKEDIKDVKKGTELFSFTSELGQSFEIERPSNSPVSQGPLVHLVVVHPTQVSDDPDNDVVTAEQQAAAVLNYEGLSLNTPPHTRT